MAKTTMKYPRSFPTRSSVFVASAARIPRPMSRPPFPLEAALVEDDLLDLPGREFLPEARHPARADALGAVGLLEVGARRDELDLLGHTTGQRRELPQLHAVGQVGPEGAAGALLLRLAVGIALGVAAGAVGHEQRLALGDPGVVLHDLVGPVGVALHRLLGRELDRLDEVDEVLDRLARPHAGIGVPGRP